MSTILEIRDLLVRRDGRNVLDIARLDVERGEVLAAVGPNGAGKTTFFLTVARLLRPQRGEIRMDGAPIFGLHETTYRRRLALVMQEPLLFDMTVRDNVAIGLGFRNIRRQETERRAQEWLERLDIGHLAERSGRKLSGGEAQRVSLARAFVLRPHLLLLDEPFSGLDSVTRMRLLSDLRMALAETGTTAIFITHDLGEARQLATQLAVFLGGKLRQTGPVREVFEQPITPQVGAFLGKQILS